MKVQAHDSLEPPLQYNQIQTPLMDQVRYGLFHHLGSYRNIIQCQINSKGKAGKGIPESIKI